MKIISAVIVVVSVGLGVATAFAVRGRSQQSQSPNESEHQRTRRLVIRGSETGPSAVMEVNEKDETALSFFGSKGDLKSSATIEFTVFPDGSNGIAFRRGSEAVMLLSSRKNDVSIAGLRLTKDGEIALSAGEQNGIPAIVSFWQGSNGGKPKAKVGLATDDLTPGLDATTPSGRSGARLWSRLPAGPSEASVVP